MISTLVQGFFWGWVFLLVFLLCFVFFSSLFGNQSVQQVLSFRTPVINLITNTYETQSQMKNRLSIYGEKSNVLSKTYDEKLDILTLIAF